jgi:hypothetical protein
LYLKHGNPDEDKVLLYTACRANHWMYLMYGNKNFSDREITENLESDIMMKLLKINANPEKTGDVAASIRLCWYMSVKT